MDLPLDVLMLICEQLLGDSTTLSSMTQVSRSWHSTILPYLLRNIDLGSHNAGRLREHENLIQEEIYADYGDRCRPKNLVTRQRRFIRLLSDRPELAKCVFSFTWTLVWLDFDDNHLIYIDRQIWTVFSRMTNVSKLDLASVHDIVDEPYVRANPDRLFPAVKGLRLSGWMHRGLVKAIMTFVDPSKLQKLTLNCLKAEGAMPNGDPMPEDISKEYALNYNDGAVRTLPSFDNDKLKCQENGTACIFPGPMWYPLRSLSLSTSPLTITHLDLSLPSIWNEDDMWTHYTFFHDTAQLISKTSQTLRSLKIAFGSHKYFYLPRKGGGCGNFSMNLWRHNIEATRIAADFMRTLLKVLHDETYPRLNRVIMAGFHILTMADPQDSRIGSLEDIFAMVRESPFTDAATWLQVPHSDYRIWYNGFDYNARHDEVIQAHREAYGDLLEMNLQGT